MLKLPVSGVKPGMKLAKDVYSDNGRLLLLAGFSTNERFIRQLPLYGISHIFVEENILPSEEAEETEETSEGQVYNEALKTIKEVFTSINGGGELDVQAVKETVENIVDKVLNNEMVMLQLSGMRDVDSYTYFHSIDVCIYSLVTAKNMEFGFNELVELGMGAILHDIGKMKIPSEILRKPGKLTSEEFETIKLHTVYGYEIISNTPGLNNRIANIAVQHHEKWDGTGYPLGLARCQINQASRIVTIADIYDALTADRIYKKKVLPHEAAEYLIGYSSAMFDPELLNIFIKNIAIYPHGTIVVLNTGEVGSVIDYHRNMPFRPKVKVIARKDGPPVFEQYEVNLLENPSVFITEILA